MPVLHAAVELTVVSPDTTRAMRSLTIGGRLPKYRTPGLPKWPTAHSRRLRQGRTLFFTDLALGKWP